MTTCCSVDKHSSVQGQCPACRTACKAVPMTTLYHQVKFPDNVSIPEDDYYFCHEPTCDVGYFGEKSALIKKSQLREAQHIEAGWLCYCFDISKTAYLSALENQCGAMIKNFIIKQTKAGSCACASRNPSGQCCLADFKRLEKETTDE